jgi:PAS domain S-box-containing protein
LIPFYVEGEAVGTIWVISHDESRRFDAEDLRVMTNLGTFAAAAYKTLLSLNATIKANQELQQSTSALRRFASMIESSDDAIVSKNLDGTITSWNKGAWRLFGYTAEEAIGKLATILIPTDRQRRKPNRCFTHRVACKERGWQGHRCVKNRAEHHRASACRTGPARKRIAAKGCGRFGKIGPLFLEPAN